VRAGGLNTLVIFTITIAGLAHRPQQERGLSAVFIGAPRLGLADSPGSISRLADNR
jgi:hypothetical protein